MRKINSIVIVCSFTAALLFIATLSGCHSGAEQQADNKPPYVLPDSLLRTLKIDTAGQCQMLQSITLTGKVAFNEDQVAKLYPMVSGTADDVKVMLGDYVKKGQVLGIIRSAEMAGYSNDLVNARSNLQVAEKNMEATQDMYNGGLVSEKDLLAAQAGLTQARSELEKASSVLRINGGNTSGAYIIRSPVSGFVVEKNVTTSMAIRSDNSSSLFTISDLKNVWVIANVYESNIANVHPGDSVDITTLSYPGKVFRGKVDKIMNILDPTNKVMKVRIMLPNPGYLLKPEMFASVTVSSRENRKVLCIPTDALIFDNSQYYVLLYESKTDIRIQPVQVQGADGDNTYVSGNLHPGDKLIGSQVLLIYQALNG